MRHIAAITRDTNPSLLEETLAAFGIGANILLSPLTRPWYSRWGSTPEEQRRSLPGDEIVASPKLVSTRAITIAAPPDAIWPWLAQLGQGRGGLYSYQKLENLAQCKIVNADRIHPEWQQPAIGDKVRFGPEGYPYQVVRAVDPGRSLVLGSEPSETKTTASWVFQLDPVGPRQTRLIVRARNGYEAKPANTIIWRLLTDPLYFVMERRMLIGIKDRAEALNLQARPV